jgi:hypothetical protein
MPGLLLGPHEIDELHDLRELAGKHEIDASMVFFNQHDREFMAAYRRQMIAQTLCLPVSYFVTFTIEVGHPSGPMRRLSMSVGRKPRVPPQEAVWMVAEELGFVGSIEQCAAWVEQLSEGGQAVNVCQPLGMSAGGRA